MKATTRRGAPGDLPAKKKKKKKKAPARGFMCGCGGAGSVSTVNISAVAATPMKAAPTVAKPAASADKTASGHDADGADAGAEGTPSVDSLLRQLRELEHGVRALGVRGRGGDRDDAGAPRSTRPRRQARGASATTSEWGGGSCVGRLDLDSKSVAVVTESEDPLGDFRRSMAQMIVANGITGGAELRELLRRFLALNSPCHHHLILLAFADVWEELFAGSPRAVAPPPPSAPLPVAAAGKVPYSYSSGDRGRASKLPESPADTLTPAPRSRRVS